MFSRGDGHGSIYMCIYNEAKKNIVETFPVVNLVITSTYQPISNPFTWLTPTQFRKTFRLEKKMLEIWWKAKQSIFFVPLHMWWSQHFKSAKSSWKLNDKKRTNDKYAFAGSALQVCCHTETKKPCIVWTKLLQLSSLRCGL